jgi:hypothetical protein
VDRKKKSEKVEPVSTRVEDVENVEDLIPKPNKWPAEGCVVEPYRITLTVEMPYGGYRDAPLQTMFKEQAAVCEFPGVPRFEAFSETIEILKNKLWGSLPENERKPAIVEFMEDWGRIMHTMRQVGKTYTKEEFLRKTLGKII